MCDYQEHRAGWPQGHRRGGPGNGVGVGGSLKSIKMKHGIKLSDLCYPPQRNFYPETDRLRMVMT